MVPSLFFAYLLIAGVVTQERFRSILIERACRQRPSLSFCSDFDLSSTPPKADVRPSRLVIPPEIDPELKATRPSVTTSPPSPKPTPTATSPQSDEVDFDNSTQPEERLGSLLKLPKPKKSPVEGEAVPRGVGPQAVASPAVGNTSITPGSIEDEKTVLVFVSEYCVVYRERFVKNCHGDVSEDQVPFCKSYPSACASTNGVIPVLTYCQRYYKHYPKFCSGPKVEQELLQFCFAFEQFCLPELTPAQPVQRPQSSLRKCEDVLPEARKVCNPFPPPRDTFNVLRCSNFLTNCKKFVDWA